MSRRVDLPSPDEVEVRIPDPVTDAKRVYRLAVMTRSKKRELGDAQDKVGKLSAALPDDKMPTVKQEEAVLRAACDVINVLLVGGEDGPAAGDLLYQAWEDEHITDDQIVGLMNKLAGEPDPT